MVKKTLKTKEPVHKAKVESKADLGSKETYLESVGRRKESIARVRLFTKKAGDRLSESHGSISINHKPHQEYFKDLFLQNVIEEPLKKLKSLDRFKGSILVKGGGLSGQAEAIRLGISRALVLFDSNYRKKLKKFGYLTQDSRIKERRKYGLKKARKAPQWAKR